MIKHCQGCKSAFESDVDWKTFCKRCYAKKKQAEAGIRPKTTSAAAVIPEDMLMRLIRLCHPDRHGNNEASNLATKWLLELRDSQRGNR